MRSDTKDLITKVAVAHGIPPAHLLAVVQVESAGIYLVPIGDKTLPPILYEPHLVYRRTDGEVRAQLVAAGLASKTPNKKLYAKTQAGRWEQLRRARAIAGDVVYECASYGVGQVLGSNWKSLGYGSLAEFVSAVSSGLEGQVDAMVRFIEVNGLVDELRDGRWPAFFRAYNGPAWEANGYGKKIEVALREFGGAYPSPDGMLRMGSNGARVRELQTLLTRAGHAVKVDGDFGPSTKLALKEFQKAHSITSDGIYGPETESALAHFRQGASDNPGGQSVTDVKEVVGGTVTGVGGYVTIDKAKDAIDTATATLQQVDGLGQVVQWALAGLSVAAAAVAVAGLAYAAYGWWKSRQTVET